MLFYIIYQSTPTGKVSLERLKEITATSVKWNNDQHITGILIYHDHQYLQYLEGHEKAVREIFQKIKKDPRHQNVIPKVVGYTNIRVFDGWSMGSWIVKNEAPEELSALSALNEYISDPLNSEFESTKYMNMMRNILHQWVQQDREHVDSLKLDNNQ